MPNRSARETCFFTLNPTDGYELTLVEDSGQYSVDYALVTVFVLDDPPTVMTWFAIAFGGLFERTDSDGTTAFRRGILDSPYYP